ncbi:MAG TPA: VOC family protein [Nitrososphaerales archaeon]|nr:VOC family protein [Nitrososphaerales archaeon]
MDKVEHFEIPADDHDRALRFYTEVFGWELNPIPGVRYTRLLTKRVNDDDLGPRPFEVNGAIITRTKELQHPFVTITVADIEKTLKRISEEGGKVLTGKTPFGSPPRGYIAYFKDTEGNTVGLWQFAPRP